MKQIITTATNDRLVALHINAITEITGKPILAASKALMIEEAKKQMREGVCHLLYVKKDGKAREAYATLNAPLIHKHIIGTGVSPESCVQNYPS